MTKPTREEVIKFLRYGENYAAYAAYKAAADMLEAQSVQTQDTPVYEIATEARINDSKFLKSLGIEQSTTKPTRVIRTKEKAMRFETKFDKGDHVWFMENNKPTEVAISDIRVLYLCTKQEGLNRLGSHVMGSTKLLEDGLFKTKGELLGSL